MTRKFTDEEKQYIITHHETKFEKEICQHLGCSAYFLKQFKMENGLGFIKQRNKLRTKVKPGYFDIDNFRVA